MHMKAVSPKAVAAVAIFALLLSFAPPFSVNAASTLTFGTETVFETGDSTYIDVAALSETTVVIAYRDEGNSNRGTAVVGTISGNSITFGTPVVFYNDNASYIAITKLDSDSFAIAYTDVDNDGSAIVGDVSGTSISFGTATEFTADSNNYKDIARIDDAIFLVAWNNTVGTQLDAVVGYASLGSITYGSTATIEGDGTTSISAAGLSSTAVLIAANDSGDSTRGKVHGVTISGTSMTGVDTQTFNATQSTFISVAPVSSTQAIITYNDQFNGASVFATFSGGSTTFGAAEVFDASSVTRMAASILVGTTTPVIAYRSADSKGKAVAGSISGTSQTFDSPFTFTNSSFNNVGAAAISSTKVVIAYQDNSNSGRGTALVATYASAASGTGNGEGGGGDAAWLFRLRQQNGLDARGNPTSSSSSSLSSVSTTSSSSSSSAPSAPSTSGGSGASSSSSSSSRWSSSSHPAAKTLSPFELRVCTRVMKSFAKNASVLTRVNDRLLKRFGFMCE